MITEIAEIITEDPNLLDEAAVTRRGFLKAAGSILSHLTSGGLSPRIAKNIVSMAAPTASTPRFMASIIAGTSGRYDPDVSESFGDAKLAYNTLRKLLGSDAAIGAANESGEEFYLGSIIGIKDIPRLLRSGKIVHEYSDEEDGTYIEVELPGDQANSWVNTIIISSEDNDYSFVPVPSGSIGPGQLIKVWWDKWEQWGTGNLDRDMLRTLRKNDIDPRRQNDEPPGEDEHKPESKDVERLNIPRDYATASSMHQWHESYFNARLNSVLVV